MAFLEEDVPQLSNSALNQLFEPWPEKVSDTSILVNIFTLGMTETPNSFVVTYQKMTNKNTPAAAPQVVTSANRLVTLTGLTPNSLYKITTQAFKDSAFGNKLSRFYKLSTSTPITAKSSTPKPIGEKIDAKSFLQLSAPEAEDKKYTYAYRNFDLPILNPVSSDYIGVGAYQRTVPVYPTAYYTFGTMFMMPSLIQGYKAQGAGLGFFVDPAKGSGYFIILETVGTAATQNAKPVKIIKVQNQSITVLSDSQKGSAASLDNIVGGRAYNVDVRVKISDKTLEIIAYVNGFKITATDTVSGTSNNSLIAPSQTIALLATAGTSYFDYAYAYNIDEKQYLSTDSLDFYRGQFSKDIINNIYGNLSYEASLEDTGQVDIERRKKSYDEFGTVVREIARRNVKFDARPSVPIGFTTGANKLTKILSETRGSFGGEVFVLNNSSVTVPLTDNNTNLLSAFGWDIGFSGEIEYATDPVSENASREPVVFESQWLHFEGDVKNLADWIRSKLINGSNVIEMEIFGNPLITVGDIITVDYPYQKMDSSIKIIIVKVSHAYEGGITTKIVGRTL